MFLITRFIDRILRCRENYMKICIYYCASIRCDYNIT
nr:MAG TPA_asm: hypothetical protein [Caudoviricetes sp.]